MNSFEKDMKELQKKLKSSMNAVVKLCKDNNLELRNRGKMGDNILILDFVDYATYTSAKKIITKGCVEGIGSISVFDGTNRIAIAF